MRGDKNSAGHEQKTHVLMPVEEIDGCENDGVGENHPLEQGLHTRVTRMPCRPWCRHHVSVRGVDSTHYNGGVPEEQSVPLVAWDYCFLQNEANEGYAPVLVSRGLGARTMAPCKGADVEWVVAQCERDPERLGRHGQVVLRSDNEPALVNVLREIARARGEARTVIEHLPLCPKLGPRQNATR